MGAAALRRGCCSRAPSIPAFPGQEGWKNALCVYVCVGLCIGVCGCLRGCRTKRVNRGEECAAYLRREAGKGKITKPQSRTPLPVFLIMQYEDVSAKAASFHSSCIMK